MALDSEKVADSWRVLKALRATAANHSIDPITVDDNWYCWRQDYIS
jgi:hypothetical protein